MQTSRKILRDRSPKDRWGEELVTVVLKGEEWTTLLARINRTPLSSLGEQVYNSAAGKLGEQIVASSNEYRKQRIQEGV